MSETDTTSPEGDEPIVPTESQPEEEAEESTEETQPTQTDEPVDENVEWLKNKGIDPSDPEAIQKAATLARNTEREFHKGRQEAKSKLKDEAVSTVNPDEYDPVIAEVMQLKTKVAVSDFYSEHPEARELDAELAEVVKARPHLAQDLEAALALVKTGKSEASIKEAEKKGREAAKADIARSSAASMPKGNASGTSPKDSDPGLEAFNKAFEEY